MHRFRILLARRPLTARIATALLVALLPAAVHGQTTLPASTTSTPWNNTATLATGSGLTINLGLGVEYLIVGGGGGGGGAMGGGGGGGGVLTGTTTLTGSTQVVVGAGGEGGYGPTYSGAGRPGSNSRLGTDLIAVGGGRGGTITLNSPQTSGTGGSGGGGGGFNDSRGNGSAGTAGQGSAGGNGSSARAGGGGGAGGIGISGSAATNAGNGGNGIASSITGTSVLYGAGGGGGANGGTAGVGGAGGGGSGVSTFIKAGDGTAGTGSGGGGSGYTDPGVFVSNDQYGGNGGSGVVIVRYQSATRLASGGSASGTTGPYWWERFTTTGTSTLSFTFNANSLLAAQSGAISGTGGLTYNSGGTLELTAANTFTGATRAQSGLLNLGNVNALQNSTLDMNGSDSGTIGFTAAGTNTYTLGGLQGSRNLASAANSLSVGGNGASTTYSGGLSSTGSLTKTGTGTLTLSGSNSISGGAAINAGTLALGSAGALGTTGTISFGGGALQYSASNTTDYSARFSTAAGQQIAIDTNGQNVSFGSALTSSGGSLRKIGTGTLTLTAANTFSDTTRVLAGGITLANVNALQNSTLDMNGSDSGTVAFGVAGTNTYTFAGLQGSRNLASGANSLSVGGNNASTTYSGGLSSTGSLTKTGTGTLTLSGSNSISGGAAINAGTLALGSAGALGTTGTISFGGGALQYSSSNTTDYSARFSTAAGQQIAIDTNGQNVSFASALTSDSGSLTKSGLGTLTLSGSNTYSGGTTVSAGRLVGTTDSLQGGITNNAAVEFAQATSGIYAGNMGGTGLLTKTGAGTVTLSGNNSFSGGTIITAGTLAVAAIADAGSSNIGTSGTLTLGGGTLDFTGSGAATTARVIDIATGNTTSTIGVADAAGRLTLTGKVWNSDVAHPNVVLNKAGPGTLEIAGAGSNVGTSLVVQSGTVVLNATQRAVYEVRGLDANATLRLERSDQIFSGDAITTTGNIRMTGGTFDLNGFNETVNRVSGADFGTAGTGVITSAAPAQFTFGNNLAGRPSRFAGTITGSVAITVKGTNPVTLSGENTYSGSTTIQDAGTQLRIGVGGTTGSLGTGAVSNGGELLIDRSDSITISNAISGSGAVTQAGVGTVTLTGSNSYLGTTTIAAGRLIGSTASLPGPIANASQLEFAQATTGTFASVISGAGSLTKSSAGNLILSGTSTYTGPTSVAGGRLSVNGSLGTSPVAVLATAELGGSGSIGGPVSIASGGTLAPGNSIQSLATGAASFASGATFAYEVDSTNLGALGTAADLLVVSGNLDIASGTLLSFTDLAATIQPFVEDTTVFAMINYSGSWNSGLFTYNGTPLADGSRFIVGSQQWEIDYNRPSATGLANFTGDYLPDSGFVAITAVPEPSTLVLMAIGAGLAAVAGLRRRAFVR